MKITTIKKLALAWMLSAAGAAQLWADLPGMTIPESLSIQSKDKTNILNFQGQQAAGFKFVRAGFQWAGIETAPGVYDFTETDQWVQEYTSRGLRISGTLVFNNALYNDHGKRGIIDDYNRQAFAAYCAAVVDRYKSYDIVWEIWNEPNLASFWQSTGSSHSQILADEYTALVKVVVPAMRAVDPDCTIVVGSISSVGKASTKWFDRCVQQGIFEVQVDGVSIHPYGFPWPELYIEKGENGLEGHGGLLRVLADAGVPDMPLLSTEVGYSIPWLDRYDVADREQAQGWMFARQHLVDQMTELRLSTWYEWKGSKWGVVNDDWSPRPAYDAAYTLSTTLNGFDYIKRLPTASPLDYVLLFEDQSGNQALAAWTVPDTSWEVRLPVDHAIDIPVDATGTLDVTATFGATSTVTVNSGEINVMLTGGPQYIELASVPVKTPGRLKATVVDEGQIDLRWNDRSSNEEGFELDYKIGAGAWTALATPAADATSHSVSGLSGATEYSFRVRAVDNGGADVSSWSNELTVTTKAGPNQIPDAPTGFVEDTALTVSADTIDIEWIDNSLYEDGFNIYHKTGSASGQYTLLATVGADVETYSHTGLAKGIKHNYRIMAYNSQGESDRLQVNETIEDEPPSTPQSLEAVAASSNQVDLTWERSTDNERVHGYAIYRDSVLVDTVEASSQEPVFSDTGLNGQTTYTYTVVAFDVAENFSSASAGSSATTIQAGNQGSASEDFESGDFAGGTGWNADWTIEGEYVDFLSGSADTGNYHLRLRSQSSITRTLSMGSAGGTLHFAWRGKSMEDNDIARIMVFDGAWHVVFTVEDGQDDDNYHFESISMAPYGTITRVRVEMDSNGTGDTFSVDDISIEPGTVSAGAGADGFESGDWTGGTGWSGPWATSGGYAELLNGSGPYSGDWHVRVRKQSAINRLLLNSVSNGTLSFAWKAKSLEGDDIAQILVYDGTWHVVFSAADGDDDNTYHTESIDLSGYGPITEVQVQIDSSGTGDSFFVDSIDIQ